MLILIFITPILIGFWAIPIKLHYVLLVVLGAIAIWGSAWLITWLWVGWPITHEYLAIGPGLVFGVPLYGYSVGAVTQVAARVFTLPDSAAEKSILLAGFALLFTGPIYLAFN